MTIEEAIAARRSIRIFKPDPIPEESIKALVESVRLAPSGSNSQPWRLKLVKDQATRERLAEAANGQGFIAKAPLVIVLCVDLGGYVEDSLVAVRELASKGERAAELTQAMLARVESWKAQPKELLEANVAFNIGIAGEHLALTAVGLGLGTCWVRALDEEKVRSVLGIDAGKVVIALMPVGFPDESPPPRRRKSREEILI
jgi:nitroreductase